MFEITKLMNNLIKILDNFLEKIHIKVRDSAKILCHRKGRWQAAFADKGADETRCRSAQR